MRSRRRGFSLIELTLAMTIVVILSLTMYKAMSFALLARHNATAAVDRMRGANIATEVLSQDLQSVLPPTGIFAGAFMGTKVAGPSGRADTVEFYCIGHDAAQDDQPMGEGIRRVDFTLRTDVTPPVLVRQVSRNLLPTVAPPPEEEIVCRNVRAFTIQYYDGQVWQDDWDSTSMGDVLPIAISITLELDPPAGGQADAKPIIISRVLPLACAKSLDAQQGAGG
jgi:type II secretion system protein J